MQYNITTGLIILIVNLMLFSACEDYDYVDPCDAIAEFTIDIDENCDFPCEVLVTQNIAGSFTSFLWNFGDGTTVENENVVSHTYDSIGFFTITLTVFDELCDNAEIAKTVSVGSTPPLAMFVPSDTLCMLIRDDCTITFDNQSLAADSYEWFLNEELVGQDSLISFTFTEPGTYDVRLEATNEFGTASFGDVVIVRPLNFGYRFFDFHSDNTKAENVYGLVISGSGSYLLMTSDKKEIGLSEVDQLGNQDVIIKKADFDGEATADQVISIVPRAFSRVGNNYVLTGDKITDDLTTPNEPVDFRGVFALSANESFSGNSVNLSQFFQANTSFHAYGLTGIDNSRFLICGDRSHLSGSDQSYLIEAEFDFPSMSFTEAGTFVENAELLAIEKINNHYLIIEKGGGNISAYLLNDSYNIAGGLENIATDNFEVIDIIWSGGTTAWVYGVNNQQGQIIRINIDGNSIVEEKDEIMSEIQIEAGLINAADELVFVGTSLLSDFPMLVVVDPQTLELIRKSNFPTTSFNSGDATTIAELPEGGYMIGGRYKIGSQSESCFLLRTDDLGGIDEIN